MSDFKMSLPQNVIFIINRLEACSHSANVVGGAVRDSLICRPLGDFDITTDATPERIKEIFSDFRTVDTGIKHGTVTLVIDHIPYEITTYRIDGDYKDNRHPDSVTFTRSLDEDLKRRDFTVNAMAYNPRDGLTDLFSGVEDARAGLIRAVGDACVRFDEDALRILRGLRFASVLGFSIEKSTARAIREKAELLKGVSGERVYQELKKLLMGVSASEIMLGFSDVLAVALDGVRVEKYPTDEKIKNASFVTRLALVFLLNAQSPTESAERTFDRLKVDNLTRYATKNALIAYDSVDFSSNSALLHSLRKFGYDAVFGALSIGLVTGRFSHIDQDKLASVMNSDPVYEVSHLNIGGRDLSALGCRGKEIGNMLAVLLNAVIDGECRNERDALICFATRLLK